MYLLFLLRDNGDYAQNPNYEIKNLISQSYSLHGDLYVCVEIIHTLSINLLI